MISGLLVGLLLVATGFWLLHYRNHLERLSCRLPLFRRQRKNRLHPLFRTRGDVVALAAWPLLLGVVLLLYLLVGR